MRNPFGRPGHPGQVSATQMGTVGVIATSALALAGKQWNFEVPVELFSLFGGLAAWGARRAFGRNGQ